MDDTSNDNELARPRVDQELAGPHHVGIQASLPAIEVIDSPGSWISKSSRRSRLDSNDSLGQFSNDGSLDAMTRGQILVPDEFGSSAVTRGSHSPARSMKVVKTKRNHSSSESSISPLPSPLPLTWAPQMKPDKRPVSRANLPGFRLEFSNSDSGAIDGENGDQRLYDENGDPVQKLGLVEFTPSRNIDNHFQSPSPLALPPPAPGRQLRRNADDENRKSFYFPGPGFESLKGEFASARELEATNQFVREAVWNLE